MITRTQSTRNEPMKLTRQTKLRNRSQSTRTPAAKRWLCLVPKWKMRIQTETTFRRATIFSARGPLNRSANAFWVQLSATSTRTRATLTKPESKTTKMTWNLRTRTIRQTKDLVETKCETSRQRLQLLRKGCKRQVTLLEINTSRTAIN